MTEPVSAHDEETAAGLAPPAGGDGSSGGETSFHADLVKGGGPRLDDETTALLRSRLLAFIGLITAVILIFWVRGLLVGEPQRYIVSDGLMVLIGAGFGLLLWRGERLNLHQLRWVEVGFGAAILALVSFNNYQVLAALAADSSVLATDQSLPIEVRMLRNSGQLLPFMWLMMLYGIFIPNDWKRAARVLAPVALVPLLLRVVVVANQPELARLVDFGGVSQTLLVLLVGYASGVYGTHVINTLRKEAFQARKMGQYRLVDRIGRGGMGEVWKASHKMLARPAAIKLIRADVLKSPSNTDTRQILGRFEREAQATASLTSPHAVVLYDFGVTDDQTFYQVMELLDGLDLDTLVKRHGPQPPGRVIALLSQACEALADAHSRGLIHRDIKPANIFACRLGRRVDFVKVLDFGLVKTVQAKDTTNLTQVGMTTGTPAYIAPEQALGEEIDGRADLYALACVGYYLLTGTLLFPNHTGVALMLEHVKTEPELPSVRTDLPIPEDLEDVIMSCLRKERQARPADAVALQGLLESCAAAGEWTQAEARRWWREHV